MLQLFSALSRTNTGLKQSGRVNWVNSKFETVTEFRNLIEC